MRNDTGIKMRSSIRERIITSRLTESERRTALQAMEDAELIADAIVWVTRKIEQLGARLFLKPSPKH